MEIKVNNHHPFNEQHKETATIMTAVGVTDHRDHFRIANDEKHSATFANAASASKKL